MTYQDLIGTTGVVVTAIDGSASNVPAGASPGDVVEFHNASGQAYFTTVQTDGTLADPVPSTKLPAAAISSSDYPAAADIAPDAPAAMQQHYEAVRNDPNAKPSDINSALSMLITAEKAQQSTATATATKNAAAAKASAQQQALATSAQQKIAVGQKPTATELAAFNALHANGGVTPSNAPADSPVIAAINGITSDPRVQQAMALGAALEGGLGSSYGAGDGGMSWGPFQINHNDGMHATISRADSENPVTAAQYMLPDYQAAVDKVPAALWQSNPMQAAAQAAFLAERPAQMYDSARVAQAWQQVSGQGGSGIGNPLAGIAPTTKTVGGRDFQWDPTTASWIPAPGLPGAAPTASDVKNFSTDPNNPQWYQMDPSSGKWSPVSGPDGSPIAPLSRTMSMLQQFQTTTAYIKQQVANGTLDLNTANQYQQANWQNYQAGLQGTTPFELQKAQEAVRQQQATEAENLIKDQLTSGQQLTQSILTSVGAMKSFNGWAPGLDPFAYARAENTLNTTQAAGGANVGSLVRSLLQASGVQVPTGGNVPPLPSSMNITAPGPTGPAAPAVAPPAPSAPLGTVTPPGLNTAGNGMTPMTPLAPMTPPAGQQTPLTQAQNLMTGIGTS